MITWNIYALSSETSQLHGVKLRGRIRKFGLQAQINILVENATDKPNVVRLAIQAQTNPKPIINFLAAIMPDSKLDLVLSNIQNPVLSKLKVNQAERYEI